MISEIYFFRILAKSLIINRILYIFIPNKCHRHIVFCKKHFEQQQTINEMWWRIKTEETVKVKVIVGNIMPGRIVNPSYTDNSSKKADHNRWIQVQSSFPNMSNIHYELIWDDWKLYWELHIEPQNVADHYNYSRIVRYIQEATKDDSSLRWYNDGQTYKVRNNSIINSDDSLEKGLMLLYEKYDKLLEECAKRFKSADLALPYKNRSELKTFEDEEEVCLRTMSLKDLFDIKLTIPDYQRIYCWNDNNIRTLWDNLKEMPEGLDYHLGAIILQRQDESCDIIDGQQRLVTLTLILRALGYEGNMPLLLQRFKSQEACENIANAKYVIQEIKGWDCDENDEMLNNILSHLTFSVLVLNSNNLDLAYTFFSNQNSKGVRLSDYDILKAHHLRYLITNDSQAEHLARKWNTMSQETDSDNEPFIHKTLGLYLYRARKWMRKHSCDEQKSNRPIKDEYSAAPLIPGIPPFGERFYFYEKIQGGAHFFAFTDYFVELYKQFIKTPQVLLLRRNLLGESHWKYESVIETVLFVYFSKFGKQYLSEALFCIAGAIAQHRYKESRALQYKINEHVQNNELVMMIDQASSPSFFLAETLPLLKRSGRDLEGGDIRIRFYNALCRVFRGLHDPEILNDEESLRTAKFTDTFIESKKNSEYE